MLVVDELDSLESNFLYKLFEYPTICESRLILIGMYDHICIYRSALSFCANREHVILGIANALDLTERVLPRMQSRAQCNPLADVN